MSEIEFTYLTQADVRATGISMKMAVEAVEDAFRLHHQGDTIMPHKTVLDMGERERGRSNAMPSYVGGEYDAFGIKWLAMPSASSGWQGSPTTLACLGCRGQPASSF
jgi:ornithine cyclodeaminase/alanine dehydrogenase-like protein (mu-crystallin family)